MPIEGMPDPARHRICRRCQKWFDPHEGQLHAPEVTGPLGGLETMRAAAGDPSALRFQCHRCTTVRRRTQLAIWIVFGVLVLTILALERLGVLR
jgi:hypothetical protein